jgi:hypothetical protein
MTNLIWATDEYATKDFKSICRKQIKLTKNPPTKLKTIQKIFNFIEILIITENTRINPYPPNFNNTPAKIIEPETGASTWALGSHK